MFWKWIPREDYTTGAAKPRTLPRGVTPIGARFIDLRKPTDTIQMIGDPGASVPDVAVDLGVADIFISDQAQTIQYTGKGERTNVGEGVDSPTMGMTVGNGGGINRPAMTNYYPPHLVSRPAISKTEKPIRNETAVSGINRPKIAEDTKDMVEGTYEEPVEPELEPALVNREDDYSDLVKLSDKDMDDIFGVDTERDIMGNSNKRKPANRVKISKQKPKRGGSSTTIGGIRV